MTEETIRFDDLGLSENVSKSIKHAGYENPTEIQAKAIPLVLQHRDIIGIAQTGTGKTASFTLPMIHRLEKGRARARMPRSLILEPTRELAAQVADSFEKYGKNSNLDLALLIGGVAMDEQEQKLNRGVDVLIATPGRLLDHFERGRVLLNSVDILVIDEADRMLDMGFIPDIEKICSLLPFTRQNLLFSATMHKDVENFVNKMVPTATQISVAKQATTSKNIEQIFVGVPRDFKQKREILRKVIEEQNEINNAILFCNRKKDVAILARSLQKHGYKAAALHGDMPQSERLEVLEKFKANEIQYLTASDVAARGLDIDTVSHVFNFDIPTQAEDYVHRIGRTGRAGRSGKAYSFVGKMEQKYLDAIVKNSELDVVWHSELDQKMWDYKPTPKPRIQTTTKDDENLNSSTSEYRNSRGEGRQQRGRGRGSQAGIGEMNLGRGPIIGFGEHIPDFMSNGINRLQKANDDEKPESEEIDHNADEKASDAEEVIENDAVSAEQSLEEASKAAEAVDQDNETEIDVKIAASQ